MSSTATDTVLAQLQAQLEAFRQTNRRRVTNIRVPDAVVRELGLRDLFTWALQNGARLTDEHDEPRTYPVVVSESLRMAEDYARVDRHWGRRPECWQYARSSRALRGISLPVKLYFIGGIPRDIHRGELERDAELLRSHWDVRLAKAAREAGKALT